MSELRDVFESKKERNDFWIAIIVILLFLLFLWKFLFNTNEKSNLIEDVSADIALVEPLPDSDGDGIYDKNDACPTLIGVASNDGCPLDSDGDGIYDSNDGCPNYKGLEVNNGCPPDSDGDGLHNEIDKCPKVVGDKKNDGCPLDSDGDGIPDAIDKCPDTPGIAENNGCPKVKIEKQDITILENAMKAVEFETGKASLKSASYPVLNQIATVFKKYPRYKLSIEGHTDNTSDDLKNLTLSKARAKACYDYLVTKGGIKKYRMSHTGYGEKRPIADNATPEGRQKNRRVAFSLNY